MAEISSGVSFFVFAWKFTHDFEYSVVKNAGDGGERKRGGGRRAVPGAMLRGVRGVQHGAVLSGDELHGLNVIILKRKQTNLYV